MDNLKEYYKQRILDCAKKNNLSEYTEEKLDKLSESELISLWDAVRYTFGDLATHRPATDEEVKKASERIPTKYHKASKKLAGS